MPGKYSSRTICVCVVCGTDFFVLHGDIARGRGLYCSKPCDVKAKARDAGPWICSRCGISKPVEDFPSHGGEPYTFCKACYQIARRAEYAKNGTYAESDRARSRQYAADHRAEKDEYLKAWHKAHPEALPLYVAKYQANNPEKVIAGRTLRKAVKRGAVLRQVCEECGSPKTEAHHYLGYAPEHRLDVQWLCRLHHKRVHKSHSL